MDIPEYCNGCRFRPKETEFKNGCRAMVEFPKNQCSFHQTVTEHEKSTKKANKRLRRLGYIR